MFNDVSHKLNSYASSFREEVRDSFGESISKEVFEALDNNICGLQATYEEAKSKKIDISAITAELRMIL